MKYIVLERFKDIATGALYQKGDVYTGARAEELSGSENRLGRPLIEASETEPKEAAKPKLKSKKKKAADE